MLRRFVRHSKNDPLVDEVDLTDITPSYAHIRHQDGRESTLSLKDLSPCPTTPPVALADVSSPIDEIGTEPINIDIPEQHNVVPHNDEHSPNHDYVRRSVRESRPPERLGY